MLRVLLSGIGLAAAGFGIKKYLENEANHDSIGYALTKAQNLMSRADAKMDEWLGENRNTFQRQIADSFGVEEEFLNGNEKKFQKAIEEGVDIERYLHLLGEIRDETDMEIEKIDMALRVIDFDVRLTEIKLALYDFKDLIKTKLNKLIQEDTRFGFYPDEDLQEILDGLAKLRVYPIQEVAPSS